MKASWSWVTAFNQCTRERIYHAIRERIYRKICPRLSPSTHTNSSEKQPCLPTWNQVERQSGCQLHTESTDKIVCRLDFEIKGQDNLISKLKTWNHVERHSCLSTWLLQPNIVSQLLTETKLTATLSCNLKLRDKTTPLEVDRQDRGSLQLKLKPRFKTILSVNW